MVGTLGSFSERLMLETPISRIFGLSACAAASETGANITGMCPPITSFIAGAVPL